MSRRKKSRKRAPSADVETEIEALRRERDAAAQEAASLRQLLEDREDEDCPRRGPNTRRAGMARNLQSEGGSQRRGTLDIFIIVIFI